MQNCLPIYTIQEIVVGYSSASPISVVKSQSSIKMKVEGGSGEDLEEEEEKDSDQSSNLINAKISRILKRTIRRNDDFLMKKEGIKTPIGMQCEKFRSIKQSNQCKNQSYVIKSAPWTILWFRILGIFSVEYIKRLCVFMFQTCSNSQLLRRVL